MRYPIYIRLNNFDMYNKIFFILFLLTFKFSCLFSHEGMWIPSLLKIIEGDMQSNGLELSAEDIYSINKSSLKDAIVHFGGGCTAEVVSDQGLILTNHHCGYSQIQQHSSLENNYLKEGFWAMSKSEELQNPGLTATFIVSIEDVTSQVLTGIENNDHPDEIIQNNIEIIQNNQSNPYYKSVVKPFYYGNKYYLITSKTYKDVRLVGAPPSAMGKFGGDTDNWVWPRHTCDFSIFRIYADKNNKPSEISENNIPYKAPVSLKVNISGIKENDFTMVFGFPGKTQQYLSSNAVNNYLEKILPARIEMRKNSLKHIDAAMDLNALNHLKYASKQSRISNAYKKWIGQDLGLRKKEAVKLKKLKEEKWMSDDFENVQLLNKLFEIENKKIEYQLAYSLFIELWYYGPEIIRFSNGFTQILGNDDFEAKINKKRISVKNYFKNYDRNVDMSVFKSLLPIYLEHIDGNLASPYLNQQAKKFSDVSKFVEHLFIKSKFSSLKSVEKVLNFSEKRIVKILSKDPIAKLSNEIYNHFRQEILPIYRNLEKQHNILMKKYLKSIMETNSEETFFADANSTIRLTYGKIEGVTDIKYNDTKIQSAKIKSVEQKEQKIYITYDFEGRTGKYDVDLYVKSGKDKSWSSKLKSVTGDVGQNQTTGTNKKIIWDVLKDRDEFKGDWVFGIGSKSRDEITYNWFTTIDGIVEKFNTGESDYKIPNRLLELYNQKNYGKYASNGTLNICFLGSNHTTGGNSGSPALDSKGRLIGINFDRTWESTMSDILFDENICRNIMVDIRYVLWVIDIYAGAGHLVDEMTLVQK